MKNHKWIELSACVLATLLFLSRPVAAQTQWRGANIESTSVPNGTQTSPLTGDGLAMFGVNQNANVVRFQMVASWADGYTIPQYAAWLQSQLAYIDQMLPLFRASGVRVILDLHTPPGGWINKNDQYPQYRMFGPSGLSWQTAFIDTWRTIAVRYKGNADIIAFDLVNEPAVGLKIGSGSSDWNTLAQSTARAIKAIDPGRSLVVEPEYGKISRLSALKPLTGIANVIYSVHYYDPFPFTDQSTKGLDQGFTYPGIIGGQYWDINRLQTTLKPLADFQARNNCRIFIGEFSSCEQIHNGSGQRYVADLINAIEKRGWDWCYHVYTPAPTPAGPELTARSFMQRNPKKKYQTFLANIATALDPTNDNCLFRFIDWDHDGYLDLTLIKRAGTGSHMTEIHCLSGASGYQKWLFNISTVIPEMGPEGEYQFVDWNHDGYLDLVLVKKSGTATKRVEVHIASGITGFKTYLLNTATVLAEQGPESEFKVVDWNADGVPDLFMIKKDRTGTGRTEVHIVSGASRFQTFIMNQFTALGPTPNWDYDLADVNHDGFLDLVGIPHQGTYSTRTETHVLSGASNFQVFLERRMTMFLAADNQWSYSFNDFNRDGNCELTGVRRNGASGKTEIHVLSGGGQ